MTLDQLKSWGADTQTGLGRCMNNEAFYLRLVGKIIADPGFERLDAALAAGDAEAIFHYAHALKGSAGNLALTPLYTPLSALTELYRAGAAEAPDPTPLARSIHTALSALKEIWSEESGVRS